MGKKREVLETVNVEAMDEQLPKKKKRAKREEVEQLEDNVVESLEENRISQDDLDKHASKVKKMLPDREERARRAQQRKMQTYVKELREKGVNEKEIMRLKKKSIKKEKGRKSLSNHTNSRDTTGLIDMELLCKDCGETFNFNSKEQIFYKERGFSPPVRCKACTNAKKERMSYLNK